MKQRFESFIASPSSMLGRAMRRAALMLLLSVLTATTAWAEDAFTDNGDGTYTINDAISLKEPSKRGYTFVGWTSSDINTPTKSVSFGPGETLDKEFKANYNLITYSITILYFI